MSNETKWSFNMLEDDDAFYIHLHPDVLLRKEDWNHARVISGQYGKHKEGTIVPFALNTEVVYIKT